MQRSYITLCFLLASFTSFSQYFVEGGVTFNTFNMKDMKALQEELFVGAPFEVRATDSFDPYLGFQFSFGKIFEKETFSWRSGAIVAYTSTGGRIGYSDYSGVLRGDQLLNLLSLGILTGIEKNTEKWSFGFDLPLTYDLTNFTLSNELIVGNQTINSENYKFNSEGLSILPRVNVLRKISSLSVGISAGYQISFFNSELEWSEDNESTITLQDSDKPLKAHWNGLRAGIILRYTIESF
jgi:hypothetical protein